MILYSWYHGNGFLENPEWNFHASMQHYQHQQTSGWILYNPFMDKVQGTCAQTPKWLLYHFSRITIGTIVDTYSTASVFHKVLEHNIVAIQQLKISTWCCFTKQSMNVVWLNKELMLSHWTINDLITTIYDTCTKSLWNIRLLQFNNWKLVPDVLLNSQWMLFYCSTVQGTLTLVHVATSAFLQLQLDHIFYLWLHSNCFAKHWSPRILQCNSWKVVSDVYECFTEQSMNVVLLHNECCFLEQ